LIAWGWVAKVDNVFVLKEMTIISEVKKIASKINEEGDLSW
jgi:hypothetical protein